MFDGEDGREANCSHLARLMEDFMAQEHLLATFCSFFGVKKFTAERQFRLKGYASSVNVSFHAFPKKVICMNLMFRADAASLLPAPYLHGFEIWLIDGKLYARIRDGWASADDWARMAYAAEHADFDGVKHLCYQVSGKPHDVYTWKFDRFMNE